MLYYSLTLILVLLVLLPVATRTFLLDPKNPLHRSISLAAFFIAILGFVEYEIAHTTEQATVEKLALVHSMMAMTIIYSASFAAYYFVAPVSAFWKKRGLMLLFILGLPMLFVWYSIFFNGKVLDINHRIIDGRWCYEINEEGITPIVFGLWFILIEFYLSISHFIAFLNSKYKEERRLKFLLFVTFTLIPLYLIYEYIFSVNSTELSDYSMTPFLAIIISIIGWIYTNFKLFEISPVAAIDNILESMSNIVLICDNEFKIKYVNQASENFFIKRKLLINKSLIEVANQFGSIPFDTFESIREMEKGEIRENTYEFENNGETKYYFLTVSPSYNQQNIKIGYVYVFTDITENTVTSNQLKEYTQQLEQSNKELERFAYIASHDMKSPLRNVVSFLSLIERKLKNNTDAELQEYINFATSNAKYMHSLVRDILEFSKISKPNEAFESLDLNQVIAQIEEHLLEDLKQKNARITYGELPSIKASKLHINQLFQNLIENGIKYNEDIAPEIKIDTVINKEVFKIIIEDNGIGIAQKFHEQIFGMFKRLHNSSQYQGTGIGLAMCKKIVEMYDGEIKIESKINEGARFIILLPVSILD